jgi:hypothetical protein
MKLLGSRTNTSAIRVRPPNSKYQLFLDSIIRFPQLVFIRKRPFFPYESFTVSTHSFRLGTN